MCRTANIDNHQPFGISPFLMEFVLDTKGEQKEIKISQALEEMA